jgi:hypothetical protein
MASTRVMSGIVSATGERVNTLEIGPMIARTPQPRYNCHCLQCGSQSSATHADIRSGAARCKASGHNAPALTHRLAVERKDGKRDAIAKAAALEAEARRARTNASIFRMESETSDYTLPASRPNNTPKHVVMSERERTVLREHRRELEEQEASERDAREAPVRAATEQLNENHAKLIALQRERLLSEIKDVDVYVDPAVATVRMTEKQASDYNREQFGLYRQAHPDVYINEALLERMSAYYGRNGLRIISSAMIDKAIERFREAALLPERPTPAPSQPYEPKPSVNLTIAAPTTKLVDGWDLVSGEPRKWTPRELDRLSSEDYRRALRLYRADLELPNVGPGSGVHR